MPFVLTRIHKHLPIRSAACLGFQIEDCLDRHQSSLSPVANSSLICDLSAMCHLETLQPTDNALGRMRRLPNTHFLIHLVQGNTESNLYLSIGDTKLELRCQSTEERLITWLNIARQLSCKSLAAAHKDAWETLQRATLEHTACAVFTALSSSLITLPCHFCLVSSKNIVSGPLSFF